jgi:hypothetical protein
MVRPSAIADLAVPARKTWHRRTRDDVNARRVRSWRHRLSTAEIALCEAALGERLTASGYELSGAPAPGRGELLRYERAAARHRLAPAWRAVKQTADRLIPQMPVAARPSGMPAIGPVITQRTQISIDAD